MANEKKSRMGWLFAGALAVFGVAVADRFPFWPPEPPKGADTRTTSAGGVRPLDEFPGGGGKATATPTTGFEKRTPGSSMTESERARYEARIRELEAEVKTLRTGSDKKQKYYTVRKGDTLWKIAKRLYGDSRRWNTLYSLNREEIKNPNRIYPLRVLRVGEVEK